MAEFHPPEGLREVVAKAISIYDWDNGISANPEIGQHQRGEADAVLAALFEACTVREEHRIVIDDERVTGLWLAAPAGGALSIAAKYASGRVERQLVIETPSEPVSSTGEEPKTDDA
jgi:hypothetical protein